MGNIKGKIKDVYHLLDSALEMQKENGIANKLSSDFGEIVKKANLRITATHLQQNVYYKIKELYEQKNLKEVYISYSSALLDGLCMYVHGEGFVKHYGVYDGGNIYNKAKQMAIDKHGNKNKFTESSVNSNTVNKKEIIFAVQKFQEIAITLLQKSEFDKYSNITFKDDIEWSECLDALIKGKIDIAIHNFPLVLSYIIQNNKPNSIFFFPYLTFNGYFLFIDSMVYKKNLFNFIS